MTNEWAHQKFTLAAYFVKLATSDLLDAAWQEASFRPVLSGLENDVLKNDAPRTHPEELALRATEWLEHSGTAPMCSFSRNSLARQRV